LSVREPRRLDRQSLAICVACCLEEWQGLLILDDGFTLRRRGGLLAQLLCCIERALSSLVLLISSGRFAQSAYLNLVMRGTGACVWRTYFHPMLT
jgi:hypothetical protein